MQSKKMKFVALVALLVVGVAVGVAVIPPPQPAMATMWGAYLYTEWDNGGARNIHVTAQLYVLGNPLGDEVLLTPNPQYTQWTGSLNDGGTTPDEVRFKWDFYNGQLGADWGYHWVPGGGGAEIDPPQFVGPSGTNFTLSIQRIPN